MDKVVLFNNWYQANYRSLMSMAHVRERDKDCFHDAYLAVRRFVLICQDDVLDYTPYYVATVKKLKLKEFVKESRYAHPDDFFFQCLNVSDDSAEEIEKKRYLEDVGRKVMRYVKKYFKDDYRMYSYCLLGLSYRDISKVLGVSQSRVRSRIITINNSIKEGKIWNC